MARQSFGVKKLTVARLKSICYDCLNLNIVRWDMNKRALDLVMANLTDDEYKAFLKGASLYFDSKAIDEKNKGRASRFCKTSLYFQNLLRSRNEQ